MKTAYKVTYNDVDKVGKILLPRLATLCWARRQALFQRKLAAGEDKRCWRMVINVTEEQIKATERQITMCLDVLKFETQEELF